MPTQTRVLSPGLTARTFLTDTGASLRAPDDWSMLPPGDAGLTRRVKAAGPSWAVQEKRGRKLFSRGLWAPASTIEAERQKLEVERADPSYAKKLNAARAKRGEKQEAYVATFGESVLAFLRFHPRHDVVAQALAARVTAHATPVGSGTVARTERIPVEARAEAAVIAWMRHQTTAYDDMAIARVKGLRREVRRELAQRSVQLLHAYRRGDDVNALTCPLQRALKPASASRA
jgi:hypothetical protein